MAERKTVKCAKCGITSKEDKSVTFHRFPLPSKQHGPLRAKVWAMFCFPNEDWTSEKHLKKLHAQHKMLCGRHFDDSSYITNERKKLNNFSIPTEAQSILSQLREEQSSSVGDGCKLQLSAVQMEVDNNTAQCPTSMEQSDLAVASTSLSSITKQQDTALSMEVEAVASTSQCFTSYNPQSPDLTKETPKRKGILKDLDVKKISDLTPRKQKLYKRCRRNLIEIMRLRRKFKDAKKCKRDVLSALNEDKSVNNFLKVNLSSSFYLLLQSQLQNGTRKNTGRRWSLDDKVLALSMYKKSSSCYRLLRRLFCLPSISSLKKLLNKIPLKCGINLQVIETIEQITTKRANKTDNICVVSFDEMSIRKNLRYNAKLDRLDGFQDHGTQGRSQEIASHALTFMATGVTKAWKQPIAYYFSGVCVTADRLAVLIKEVLSACFRAGLEVVGVVCDLDGVNLRAINILGSSTERPFFNHEGHEIVTVIDPPHLLKCFRNNFLKHNVQFENDIQVDGQRTIGIAKWSHLEEFFNIDEHNTFFVHAPALTRQHLQPNGKQKMKVQLAAQVLSHSVASGLIARVGLNELPRDALATATLVTNMDKLFDAVNGDTPDRKRGKQFLTNMSSTSGHLQLFNKMKKFFSNMKFLGARCKPPSQDGWLRTLNAIEKIYKNLRKYDIKTLSVRRLNQDPLENCFGCIRSNCGCNPNPTSVEFIAALKTSIITNLINNNKNRNCLDDDNNILNNFKVFLSKGCKEKKNDSNSSPSFPADKFISSVSLSYEELDIPQCSGEMQACAYVCGFIAKNIGIHCNQCKNTMLADPNTEVCHLFTSFKEYDDLRNTLNYVQPSFCKMVENAAIIIKEYLKENAHKDKIKYNLILKCAGLNKDWLKGCEEHHETNFNKIIESTICICLKRFCTVKNREFLDEASKKSLLRKINILKNV